MIKLFFSLFSVSMNAEMWFLVVAVKVVLVLSLAEATILGPTGLLHNISNYRRVSCNFTVDACGWENDGGNNPLTWKRETGCMELDLKRDDAAKGRLASPWLPPLPGYGCRLGFQYFMSRPNWNGCRLSLKRQTQEGEETLWSTTTSTGLSDFSDPITVNVKCNEAPYRMVFEGQGYCRKFDVLELFSDAIRLKNVNFQVCASSATTRKKRQESSATRTKPQCIWKNYADMDTNHTAHILGSGTLAGIIVVSIVIIVVVVGAVVALVKKKKPREECKRRLLAGFESYSNPSRGNIVVYENFNPTGSFHREEAENTDDEAENSSAHRLAEEYSRLGRGAREGERRSSGLHHYHHFRDTEGDYSTTNEEGRKREEQRKMAADQYSHI